MPYPLLLKQPLKAATEPLKERHGPKQVSLRLHLAPNPREEGTEPKPQDVGSPLSHVLGRQTGRQTGRHTHTEDTFQNEV